MLPPMEGTMGATTILVIVLAVVVFGGMAAMLIYINTEPKKGSKERPKGRNRLRSFKASALLALQS